MAAYATVTQFRQLAPRAAAFVNIADDVIEAALEDNSRLADGYLTRKFVLPLVAWQGDLTRKIIDMTAWDLISLRGYNPDTGDAVLEVRWKAAMDWLKSIPLGTTPMVTDSSSGAQPGQNDLSPTVTSATQRGFSSRPVQASYPPNVGDYIGN
jgi:phage gp36-like protein